MDHLLEIFNQPATHKHVDKGSQETPRKTVVQLCESVNLLKKQAPQLCELFRDGGKTLESEQLTRLENGMILFERLRNVQPRNARKPDFDRASELLKTLNEMAVEAVACGSDEGQASASEIPRNPRIQWNPESMPERMSSKKQRSVTKHQFEQNAQKMVSQDVKLNGIRIKNGEELTVTILPHEWETPYGKPGFELESVSDVSVATAGLMDQTWDQDQSKVTWRDGDRWAGVRPIARVRRGVDDKSAELMRNVQGYGKIREGVLLGARMHLAGWLESEMVALHLSNRYAPCRVQQDSTDDTRFVDKFRRGCEFHSSDPNGHRKPRGSHVVVRDASGYRQK
eukprot:SAG11_NODE_439_length_9453_cov_8.007483_3_plen_340_part_00